MRLPKLEGKTGSTELNRQFLGYRHVDAPDEGAFYEMENVTSERYPLMAPRSPRAKLYTLQNPGGLCAKTALAWTENGKLYYGGEAVADVSEGEKTFVSMGAWLIVFPDGVRYNTADGTVDAIGQKNVTDGTVNFTLCEADGTAYSDYTVSETEPEDTTKYWLCTGSDPHCLKKYSAATKLWNTIPTTYVMISAAGIGKNLAEGDTVTVSGVLDSVGADLNGEMLLQQAADDAVVVVGFLDETASQTDAVTLERKAPKLDYVVECNNRLWGCSSEENEIYACKLGDATNWNCFAGLATDSYTVSVGSDGPFTGAATCLGSVLFFKENALHKLYGSKPSDFQLSSLRCRGVARNAAGSLCVLNETLYYLSPDGVMAWDGSIPTKVSEKLNTARLSNVQTAVGGALDGRYYLYLARDSGREGDALEERLLVYDTERGLWQEEDGCSYAMASTGGQLYLWDGHDIWAADPSRERDWKTTEGVEETVDFELITGAFGMDEAEDRYLSRLTLQMDAVCASTVELAICYDDGPWEKLAEWAVAGKQKRFDLHLAPRRCGIFRLRLTGKGQITLRSLARTLATARGRLMEQEA